MRTPVFAVLVAGCLLSALAAHSQAEGPLFQQPPTDEVTLDEANGNVTLQVRPIDLPLRKMPAAPNPTDEIEIELVDRPGDRFRVAWGSITKIKFFEQAVLVEAQQQLLAGDFDRAYASLHYLETNYPQTPGLAAAVENFLWLQIGNAYKADRNDEALALLLELYGRNPRRAGLSTAYERVTVKLVASHAAGGNYRAARGLLRNLRDRFPQSTIIAEQEGALQAAAAKFYREAKQQLGKGDFRAAHIASEQMLDIWPAAVSGQQLAAAVHARYPLIAVGVTSTAPAASPLPQDAWAAQRIAGLLERELFEPADLGTEQASYQSALAEIVAGDDARQLTLRIKPGCSWPASGSRVTAVDVARCLLARAEPANPACDAAWSEICAGVSVPSLFELQLQFRHPVPRPEAFLQTPIEARDPLATDGLSRLGPFRIGEQTAHATHFLRQGKPASGPGSGPSEIVERTYHDVEAALSALKRGEVSIVDRVPPWELKRLAGNAEIVVVPYAFPTLHLLVPNPHRPLSANRELRRAILCGIDRAAILQRGLLGEQMIAGCAVVSGPFPRATVKDDPKAYAHDESMLPRPYDANLAIALAGTAIREERVAAKLRGDAPIDAAPLLVLQHPPEATARMACRSIARQLQLLGLKITLQELSSAEPASDDYDLRYVELPLREPVVDAWRTLGPRGITGACSPAMSQALAALAAAEDWPQTVARLHAIQHLAGAELPVIPLWQIVDHLAYHSSVKGISPRPFRLYQNVEQWQADLRIPSQ